MTQFNLRREDCQGWIAGAVAQRVYDLTPQEWEVIKRELKGTGAICPRKGIAINALERVVPKMRMETVQ
jgi:hypothetical protein